VIQMVFSGIFRIDSADYENTRDALEKLKLNDSAFRNAEERPMHGMLLDSRHADEHCDLRGGGGATRAAPEVCSAARTPKHGERY